MRNIFGAVTLVKSMTRCGVLSIILVSSLLLTACNSEDSLSNSESINTANGSNPQNVVPLTGESVYASKCRACHDYGVAGAPRYGNAEVWAQRSAKGLDVLYENSIRGIRAMPAKGGCYACSDQDIKTAVDYILANSQ